MTVYCMPWIEWMHSSTCTYSTFFHHDVLFSATIYDVGHLDDSYSLSQMDAQ